jgi:hypothetical protein
VPHRCRWVQGCRSPDSGIGRSDFHLLLGILWSCKTLRYMCYMTIIIESCAHSSKYILCFLTDSVMIPESVYDQGGSEKATAVFRCVRFYAAHSHQNERSHDHKLPTHSSTKKKTT